MPGTSSVENTSSLDRLDKLRGGRVELGMDREDAEPLELAAREELVAFAPCRDRSVEDRWIGHIPIR